MPNSWMGSALLATKYVLIFVLLSPTNGFVTSFPKNQNMHGKRSAALLSPTSSHTNLYPITRGRRRQNTNIAPLYMAVDQKQAQSGIDKVVNALRRDKNAIEEIGRLVKVTNVLGYGSPQTGTLAVRFNAQFQKTGFGLSSVPLPFGLGQSNKSEGRGVMVGQVKASVDATSGKVLSCSVFRDLGYGRAYNMKI